MTINGPYGYHKDKAIFLLFLSNFSPLVDSNFYTTTDWPPIRFSKNTVRLHSSFPKSCCQVTFEFSLKLLVRSVRFVGLVTWRKISMKLANLASYFRENSSGIICPVFWNQIPIKSQSVIMLVWTSLEIDAWTERMDGKISASIILATKKRNTVVLSFMLLALLLCITDNGIYVGIYSPGTGANPAATTIQSITSSIIWNRDVFKGLHFQHFTGNLRHIKWNRRFSIVYTHQMMAKYLARDR